VPSVGGARSFAAAAFEDGVVRLLTGPHGGDLHWTPIHTSPHRITSVTCVARAAVAAKATAASGASHAVLCGGHFSGIVCLSPDSHHSEGHCTVERIPCNEWVVSLASVSLSEGRRPVVGAVLADESAQLFAMAPARQAPHPASTHPHT